MKDLIAGIEPKNVGALADPTAFDEYRQMSDVGLNNWTMSAAPVAVQ